MSFTNDLKKYQGECERAANKALRRIALVALRKIVKRTPVKTGCARANWNVAVDKPDESCDMSGTDVSGEKTLARGGEEIAKAQIGCEIHMTNTVPYIEILEYGYSKQAPNGMIELTREEIQNMIDRGAH